jgi:hypothetical protein
MFWRRVTYRGLSCLGILFNLILLVAIPIWGYSLIHDAQTQRKTARAFQTAPRMSLSQLLQAGGNGKRVRVDAVAEGRPSLVAPNGTKLAFEGVSVYHYDSGKDKNVYAFHRLISHLQVRDDAAEMAVQMRNVSYRYMAPPVSAEIPQNKVIPASIAALLVPALRDAPAVPGDTISVYTIPADTSVTILGTVVQEEGKPVLDAVRDDKPFVVSPLPFAAILAEARGDSGENLVWGWIEVVIVPGSLLAFGLLSLWRRSHPVRVRSGPERNAFLVRRDEEAIVFRRPIFLRLLIGGVALLFAAMTLALLAIIKEATPDLRLVLCGIALIPGLFMIWFLYMAGPCELYIDLKQRTFRYRRGLPLLTKTSRGTIDQFASLAVQSIVYYSYGTRMPESRLYLVWKHAPKIAGVLPQPRLLLGILSSPEAAQRQQHELAQALGLPT